MYIWHFIFSLLFAEVAWSREGPSVAPEVRAPQLKTTSMNNLSHEKILQSKGRRKRRSYAMYMHPVLSTEDKLRQSLIAYYNKKSLPSTNTTVTVGFTILSIDVNERKHSVKLNLWTRMAWFDPRLTWNTTTYPRKLIIFPREDIWHPDISLYNNADAKNFDHFVDSPMHVTNGSVLWVPPGTIEAQCVIDTTYWPHDVQNCTAKFGSWIYNGLTMDLVKMHNPIDTDHLLDEDTKLLKFSEWKLLDLSLSREQKIYPCCPEPYVSLMIRISLERVAPGYYWLVQIPVVGMSLLTVVVFLLSPSSGDKLLLGGVGLIINLFFLFTATQVIGHSPTHTPLIIKIIVNQFLLTLTSLIVCCLVLRLSRDPHSSGVPRFIKLPLLTLSAFMYIDNYRYLVSHSAPLKQDESLITDGEYGRSLLDSGERGKKVEWLLLGAFVDRVFLIVYIFIFFVDMICFSGVV